jgi:hypothetical protein
VTRYVLGPYSTQFFRQSVVAKRRLHANLNDPLRAGRCSRPIRVATWGRLPSPSSPWKALPRRPRSSMATYQTPTRDLPGRPDVPSGCWVFWRSARCWRRRSCGHGQGDGLQPAHALSGAPGVGGGAGVSMSGGGYTLAGGFWGVGSAGSREVEPIYLPIVLKNS